MELPEDQAWVFDMVNNILIEVLGTIAKLARVTIKQRQLEGIMAAHRRGVVFGRPRIQKPPNWDSVIAALKDGKITSMQAMELTGMKRTSFYKLLADPWEYLQQHHIKRAMNLPRTGFPALFYPINEYVFGFIALENWQECLLS